MKILPAPYELMTEVQDELSLFLKNSKDSIMDEWHILAIEELEYSDTPTYKQVEDGLREILETLTSILGGEEEFKKLTELAIAHGKHRSDLGWHINNLVTDYDLFRRVIIHRYREFRKDQTIEKAEKTYHEEMVLHWLIDKAISSGAQSILDFTVAKNMVIQAELKHRKMITEPITGDIEKQVAYQEQTIEEAEREVEEGIHALENAQRLSTEEGCKSINLKYLAMGSVSSYRNRGKMLNIEGPEINISVSRCRAVYLILHELATNAAKYGAFSTDEGKVNVSWKKKDNKVLIEWVESEGPEVKKPGHEFGYGRTLMNMLAAELSGKLVIQYNPEGLRASLEFQQ